MDRKLIFTQNHVCEWVSAISHISNCSANITSVCGNGNEGCPLISVLEVCGNKFMTQNSLMTHMEVHSDQKRFECSFCKKKFKRKEKLKYHERIHTGMCSVDLVLHSSFYQITDGSTLMIIVSIM